MCVYMYSAVACILCISHISMHTRTMFSFFYHLSIVCVRVRVVSFKLCERMGALGRASVDDKCAVKTADKTISIIIIIN